MPEANLFLMFTQRLNTLGVAYMVSGSVAVIIYGEPRLTHDVDLIVVLDRGHIARAARSIPASTVIVRKLEYYREGGSDKHLRDIRSMLNTSPDAIQSAELEQQIAARGLQEAWRQVQERKD
jgi:hypothetical protein